MTTEMDLMRMDERQRGAWLMANRATVIAVGLTWLGMIVWELAHDRSPVFLVVMVPVFALFRVALYLHYLRLPGSAGRGAGVAKALRLAAGLLLPVSAFLPLFRLESGTVAAWQLARDEWETLFLVVFAFFWPVGVLLLSRLLRPGRIAVIAQFAEPVLAAASTAAVLWIPSVVWEYQSALLPWLWIPARARPEVGVLVAAGANGLYVLGWLVGILRRGAGGTQTSR